MMLNINDLKNIYSGNYVTVAFIDDGIKNSICSKIKHYNVDDGIVNMVTEEENAELTSCHGTACAQKLLSYAPECNIIDFNMKDLNEENIIAALEYLYDNNIEVDVVNMSIGIFKFSIKLLETCKKLFEKGIILNSAAGKDNLITYPAEFESVIKIKYIDDNDENVVRESDNTFIVHSKGQYIPSMEKATNGTSIATAIFSAYCALLIESRPLLTKKDILNLIFNREIKNNEVDKTDQIKTDESYNFKKNFYQKSIEIKEKSLLSILGMQSDEYRNFIDLLDENIVGFYDLENKSFFMRSSDEEAPYNNLYIVNSEANFKEAAFSKELLPPDIKEPILCGRFNRKADAINTTTIFDNSSEMYHTDRPVILICGYNMDCSKFITQLSLTKHFKENDIPVHNITFNPLGAFFNMSLFNYPNKVVYPDIIHMLNNYINNIDDEYEALLINVPGGIAHNPDDINNFGSIYHAFFNCIDADIAILCINNKMNTLELKNEIHRLNCIGINDIIIVVSNIACYKIGNDQKFYYSIKPELVQIHIEHLNTIFPDSVIMSHEDLYTNKIFDFIIAALT